MTAAKKAEDCSSDPPSVNAQEAFQVYRDYLKHEDILINNRLSTLLVTTGVLLTAYVTLSGFLLFSIWAILEDEKLDVLKVSIFDDKKLIFIPLFLISAVGMSTALTCLGAIFGAGRSVKSVLAKWSKIKPRLVGGEWLPELTFGFSTPSRFIAGYPKTVCIAVGVIWAVSVFVDAFLVGYFRGIDVQLLDKFPLPK